MTSDNSIASKFGIENTNKVQSAVISMQREQIIRHRKCRSMIGEIRQSVSRMKSDKITDSIMEIQGCFFLIQKMMTYESFRKNVGVDASFHTIMSLSAGMRWKSSSSAPQRWAASWKAENCHGGLRSPRLSWEHVRRLPDSQAASSHLGPACSPASPTKRTLSDFSSSA